MREVTALAASPPTSIWEGIYPTLAEARGGDEVFAASGWLERLTTGHSQRMKAHASGTLETATTTDYVLYPVAALAALRKQPLRILDFGGGLANAFYPLLGHLGETAAFELHVVENAAVCERGRALVRDTRVVFHETLPAVGRFDIVHAGSSLHYVDEWQAAIARFHAYTPAHLILADVPAGAIPRTVATRQNYYGATIPCWLFRLDELRAACERNGYRLAFQARFKRPYLAQDIPPPMAALPSAYRLEAFCQLLFARSEL